MRAGPRGPQPARLTKAEPTMFTNNTSLVELAQRRREYDDAFPQDRPMIDRYWRETKAPALAALLAVQPPHSGRRDLGFPVRDLVKVVTYVRRRPRGLVHPTPGEVARAAALTIQAQESAARAAILLLPIGQVVSNPRPV